MCSYCACNRRIKDWEKRQDVSRFERGVLKICKMPEEGLGPHVVVSGKSDLVYTRRVVKKLYIGSLYGGSMKVGKHEVLYLNLRMPVCF